MDREQEVHEDAAALLEAILVAREGDPLPLCALLWGRIITGAQIVADPQIVERAEAAGERVLILDDYQIDVLRSLFSPTLRELYVKGNTGCGKGAVAAIAVCVYYLIWPDSRVVLTRDNKENAVKVIFGEVAKWWKRMRWQPRWADVQTAAIVDVKHREHEIVTANPMHSEGFTGVHSPHVLYCFDEATAPPLEKRFELADTQASKFMALANPRTTSGKFRAAFDLADDPDVTQTVLAPLGWRRLITIDGADMVNVKLKRLEHPVAPAGGLDVQGRRFNAGEPIPHELQRWTRRLIPGQTGYDTWLGLCANPSADFVSIYARGRFPGVDPELGLIHRKWFDRPCRRWNKWHRCWRRAIEHPRWRRFRTTLDKLLPVESFGLDVGASDKGDPSILTAGGKHGVRMQHQTHCSDAVDLVDWIEQISLLHYGVDLRNGGVPIGIDSVGVGWGIGGIMRKRGIRVIEIHGSKTSEVDPKLYANMRAEAYGELAARIDPKGKFAHAVPFALPDDQLLKQDLTAPEKVFKKDGICYSITPKRPVAGVPAEKQRVTILDKIGRSPDRGDSLAYWWRAQQQAGFDLAEFLAKGAF